MPTISIIIPSFNRLTFLKTAIKSVLDQTFQDFELIVVDDSSEVNPEDVVRGFQDERITFFRHKENRGEAAARNTGIRQSSGQYIAFLDDDDEWLPQKLELQMKVLTNGPDNLGLVYTSFEAIDFDNNDKVIWQKTANERGDVYQRMLGRNLIGATSTVALKRACLDKVGLFDESIPYGVDHELWLRISRYYQFEYIDIPLVRYTIHSKRLSSDLDIVVRGFEERLKKYPDCLIYHRKYYSGQYLFYGAMFSLKGDTKRGRQLFRESIKLDPFYLRAYFNLILSFLGAGLYKKLKSLARS